MLRSTRLFWLFLALAPLVAWGAEATESEPERLGTETCAACHDELAAAFAGNVHLLADPEFACEGCHGPGQTHVEEGEPEAIGRFGESIPATQVNAACLTCHGKDQVRWGWKAADHGRAGLACTSCHAIHAPEHRRRLLTDATPSLCYGCHAEVRAQFLLTENHPVERGNMDCVDCHNPHVAADRRLLGGFKQERCLDCHSEYRGPWFFEHEVVPVEGCVACHTPHGSVNRHLLTYQRVSDLCLSCHPGQPFFHVATDPSGERTTAINDCTRCHVNIHGSNSDALFLD